MARRNALVGVLAGGLLLCAAPSPPAALRVLAHPGRAAAVTGPLVAAVAVLAWALGAWVLLTVLLTAGSRLYGPLGTACDRALRRAAPAALRRAVALSLGVGVVLGAPGLAQAQAAPTPAGSAAAAGVPAAGGPVVGAPLDWPMGPGLPPATPPAAPPAAPPPAAAPALQPVPQPGRPAGEVVVERGDSLWRLAAEHLPAGASDAAVAASWPSWWAANRQVIGDDPGLLHPGQHLVVPAAPPTTG